MDQHRTGLAKYLSRLDVWALSLSCIIGWGAFVMPGTTSGPAWQLSIGLMLWAGDRA